MSATLKTEREEREEAPRHDYLNSQGREESVIIWEHQRTRCPIIEEQKAEK